MNPVTVFFGRLLVKLPFFTMPNIIAGREVYPEFLQGEVSPEKFALVSVGRQDAKKHLEENVTSLMSSNIVQTLGTMLDTVVF